ncbi:MAG: MgtC/SapB family protein [Chloroflexi bacterium]|nr:MgtC/SapB family protein [Chloroflexota bacterium]MBP8059234.1 MgtC/SapB family protein [Chloroflexota bacterium]
MIEQLQVLLHILLAMGLGGIVGYEREQADKPAGLRTHMLVAGAAALLTTLGNIVVGAIRTEDVHLTTDPIRILEAIVTAVGFLGAGTIMRQRDGTQIEGLTTAASLLLTAGVGIGVGLRQYVLAIGVVILTLLVLRSVKIFVVEKINEDVLHERPPAKNGP